MKRALALDLIRYAGYHDDRAAFTRLYINSSVAYGPAKDAYAQGRAARVRGLRCECPECKTVAS